MSDDSFTEITSLSWFSRLGKSLVGIIVGLVLIGGSVFLLSWNEGRSVKRAKVLKEGAGSVVSVASDSINPQNNEKLVHMSGVAKSKEIVKDKNFGVSANGLKLSREVLMYQWQQKTERTKTKKLGGGTTTKKTYTYTKFWDKFPRGTEHFKVKEGHENPESMPYRSISFYDFKSKIGVFSLSLGLLSRMSNYKPFLIDSSHKETLPADLKDKVVVHDGGYYLGSSPDDPKIGDIKISYKIVESPQTVSLVAKQSGKSLRPYITKDKAVIGLLSMGSVSAVEMFAKAQTKNENITWLIRGGGYLLVFIAFMMIVSPLSVLADVLPVLGDIVGMGGALVALVLATFVTSITIAIAWVVYRPLIGGALIVSAITPFILLMLKKKSGSSRGLGEAVAEG